MDAKRLHLVTARHSKDPRNQVIGVLKVGFTVNDIMHHFGCSRQTIHDLMNRYTSTASVKSPCKTLSRKGDNVTSSSRYTLIHPRNRFNQQPLLLAFTGFMLKTSLIISY